ncbi:MAG: anti-sigma factor [Patescibacteria group bacterium]
MPANTKILITVVVLIIISGYAWIFLANDNTEEPMANTNVNNSVMVDLVFGQVSTSCVQDEDCQIINREKDYTSCCATPECPVYTEDKYVAVNLESFNDLVADGKAQQICPAVPCPQYAPCYMIEKNNITAKCVDNTCKKIADDSESNNNSIVNTNTTVEMQYRFTGLLTDVSGGSGFGEAKANFENAKYDLLVTFENLPDPEGTNYYEGWIVRSYPQSVVSTGVVVKDGGIYKNTYTTDQDLTDHDFYVLTLEPDDNDPAPAIHIMEGLLSI